MQRAYLARVACGSGDNAVALCLRLESAGPDPAIAQQVRQVFAAMFGKHEHMDVIFLSDKQEAELAPLYAADEDWLNHLDGAG